MDLMLPSAFKPLTWQPRMPYLIHATSDTRKVPVDMPIDFTSSGFFKNYIIFK